LFLGKTTLRLEKRDWTDSPFGKELGGKDGDITGSVSVRLLSLADWTDLPFEQELGGEKGMMINIMAVRNVIATEHLER
jgi:hypothetical protein